MIMTYQPDGNQSRKGITDHRQPQCGKPGMRTGSQFKGKLFDRMPRLRKLPQFSGKRTVGQDGNRESLIPAVFPQYAGSNDLRLGSSGCFCNPGAGIGKGFLPGFAVMFREFQYRPAQESRAEIAVADDGVT